MVILRICIVGEYSDPPDEGMKNVAYNLTKELSKHHDVIELTTKNVKNAILRNKPLNILSPNFKKAIRSLKPQIIHYIPYSGPTLFSFLRAKILSLYTNNAKIILSALQPRKYSHLSKKIIPLIKPDLVLIQSYKIEATLNEVTCKTKFLPNGVDIEKFFPVNKEIKEKLRKKYELEINKFIILHVGHLKKERNLRLLCKLKKDNLVIIVGSTSTIPDKDVFSNLTDKGIIVWNTYVEKIEEIFQLADCYVFTPENEFAGIEIPLSVMEAAACNLPIISTKFGALDRIFNEKNGFFFVKNKNEFTDKIQIIKDGVNVKTREMVLPYSWKNVVTSLEEIYEEFL